MSADYRKVISFIKELEGGLSRATTDPAYSNCQSGCSAMKGSVTASDWHTNEGITWCTFKAWAEKNDIPQSKWCSMFINMSEDTWEKIFKQEFWDKAKLDNLKSQAIAEYWVNARWGNPSTAQRLLREALEKNGISVKDEKPDTLISSINAVVKEGDKINEVKKEYDIFTDFVETRKDWLRTLPAAKNNKGWFKRQDAFLDRGQSLIKSKFDIRERFKIKALSFLYPEYKQFTGDNKSNVLLLGLGIIAIGTISIYYINKQTK